MKVILKRFLRQKNSTYLTVCVLCLLSCNGPKTSGHNADPGFDLSFVEKEALAENGYKVVGIKDGDTFVLLMDGKEQVVRFAHIDCPEKKQPFGTKAKQFVSDLCFGEYVTLIHNKKFDRNKRLIAEVLRKDGTNLNKMLVLNGLAWHYKEYSKSTEYQELELVAKQNKVGLWIDNEPVAPWQWRK